MSAAVDRVLERLQNVRRVRGGWRARCPAHPDRTPSLAVREGADGRALLLCRAACRTADVVAALDLRWADLFAVAAHGPHRSARYVRRSPLDDARHAVITEVRRYARRLAPYRDAFLDADSIRIANQTIARARQYATVLGDRDEAWTLLAMAASLERDTLAAEARLDAEVSRDS